MSKSLIKSETIIMKESNSVVLKSSNYIRQLLNRELPLSLVYHSLEHTQLVVAGAKELCTHIKLTNQEKQIVLLAAWFHDSGHTVAYKGHEDFSQSIAHNFLSELKVETEVIRLVIDCIEATKMPQRPKNLLQKILCDADLYHLSLSDYDDYEYLLRVEWDLTLNQTYTDEEWRNLNTVFLAQHRYFTPFAKKVWEKKKRLNLQTLRKQGKQNKKAKSTSIVKKELLATIPH